MGREAAENAFNIFPGDWEISQLVNNLSATVFWRKVISEYSTTGYSEQEYENNVIQIFNNSTN